MARHNFSRAVRFAGVMLALILVATACSENDVEPANQEKQPSGGAADVGTGKANSDLDTGDDGQDLSDASTSGNGGLLDDRQCGPVSDDVLFFGRGDDSDLTALSSTGEVLWTVPGVREVERNPQGTDWVVLRNGEVLNFETGLVVPESHVTGLGGVLSDCRAVYRVPPQGLVGHDGSFVWQVDTSQVRVPGEYRGSDEGVLVFALELEIGEDFALDGAPDDNLMGLADDGSVVWSRMAKGSLRYENGVIGIGGDVEPTVWFDGATGEEMFSTDAKFNQVLECGTTLWFHVRGDDGFGLEVRDAQTGKLLYENDQVLNAAAGYDGYGDESYWAQGDSAGYQIGEQFTFVPDCLKPDEPAWTATASFDNDILIVGDVVYSPQSRTVIDRISGEILIEQTDEYAKFSTNEALVGTAERDGLFGLAFYDPRTFSELAFIEGPSYLAALRVPNWADPTVFRLSLFDGTSTVIDARTGETLVTLP